MVASGQLDGITLINFRTNSWFQRIEQDFIKGTLGRGVNGTGELKVNEYMNDLTDGTGRCLSS